MKSKNNIKFEILLLIISEYWKFLREKIREYFKRIEILYKDIKNKKYFYITEQGYTTDLKKRRELGKHIYNMLHLLVISIVIVVLFMIFLFGFKSNTFFVLLIYILLGAVCIALFGIAFVARYYFTNFYYYITPFFTLVIYYNYIDKLTTLSGMLLFFMVSFIVYLILTIFLPIPYLRRVKSTTWILGILTTLAVPLLVEYGVSAALSSILQSQMMVLETITIENLQNTGEFTDSMLEVFKANPVLFDTTKDFMKILISYEVDNMVKLSSRISFLCLNSYSIGILLINLKLRLGDSKAKDSYNKFLLKSIESDLEQYTLLRDCVFYGGDKFEERIVHNSEYISIINRYECPSEFYEEKRMLILFLKSLPSWLKELLKNFI